MNNMTQLDQISCQAIDRPVPIPGKREERTKDKHPISRVTGVIDKQQYSSSVAFGVERALGL